MTPAELHKIADTALKAATFTAETRGPSADHALEIMGYAMVSIAASLALLARPPGRATFGEYEHDEAVADRQETWAEPDPDEQSARQIRRDRD